MSVGLVFFVLLSGFFSYRIVCDYVHGVRSTSFRSVFVCVFTNMIEGDSVRHLFGGVRDETRICIV
jgi:uncharacterized membrane protein